MPDEDTPAPQLIQVTGGAGSTMAHLDDLLRVAQLSTTLAGEVRDLASEIGAIADDDALLGAIALDPMEVADVQFELGNLQNGFGGLGSFADELDERAAQMTTVRQAYIDSDERQAAAMDLVNWIEGVTGIAVISLVDDTAADVVARGVLPNDLEQSLLGPNRLSDPLGWILAHPGLAEDKIQSLPGLLGWGPGTSWQDMVAIIAGRLNDGQGVARTDKLTSVVAYSTPPPADLTGVFANLIRRNSPAVAGNDEIDVQRITQADGSVAYIVNIPGTKDDSQDFSELNPNTNDNVTNLVTLAGMTSSREEAIADALALAGASSDDPVMLVGHSQGGMVAAQAAADSVNGSFNYNVTNVVTAGSPVALADIPDDVQVLSLENVNDAVPWLDGEPNPASANHTTVQFSSDSGTFDNHSLQGSYLVMAEELTDHPGMAPSVDAFMDSASAFLTDPAGGTTALTTVYDLHREAG